MGRAGLRPIVWKFDGPGRAAAHHLKIRWAGLGCSSSCENLMGRAGPRPTICGLYMGRFAPMRRPTTFQKPARATAHEMWCTVAAIMCAKAKSTLTMTCPTRFCGPARAAAHHMLCALSTTIYDDFDVRPAHARQLTHICWPRHGPARVQPVQISRRRAVYGLFRSEKQQQQAGKTNGFDTRDMHTERKLKMVCKSGFQIIPMQSQKFNNLGPFQPSVAVYTSYNYFCVECLLRYSIAVCCTHYRGNI